MWGHRSCAEKKLLSLVGKNIEFGRAEIQRTDTQAPSPRAENTKRERVIGLAIEPQSTAREFRFGFASERRTQAAARRHQPAAALHSA